jgi:DNA-binding NarL/FixJ family response regulator
VLRAKQLRILFVDDEELEIFNLLKSEGYDVDHWTDVATMDSLCDGRFHVIFLDVRGVGSKFGGSGIDLLKYVAKHSPLTQRYIFSAKPFSAAETQVIQKCANDTLSKDSGFFEIVEELDRYARSITAERVINLIENEGIKLSWFDKWRIKRGHELPKARLEVLSKGLSASADGLKIVANATAIAATLMKISLAAS